MLSPGRAGTERLATLSNRAAARLALGQYEGAHADCCSGLLAALALLSAAALPTVSHQQEQGGCEQQGVEAQPSVWSEVEPVLDAMRNSQGAGSASGGAPSHSLSAHEADSHLHSWLLQLSPGLLRQLQPAVANATVGVETQGEGGDKERVPGPELQPAQEGGSQALNQGAAVAGGVEGLLGSTARLLARRGAARGHMRLYTAAAADCQSASHLQVGCAPLNLKAFAFSQTPKLCTFTSSAPIVQTQSPHGSLSSWQCRKNVADVK